jgi:phage tail-like protein
MAGREDPLVVNYWEVDFQGALKGPFSSCQLPQSSTFVSTYHGQLAKGEHDLDVQPGQTQYSDLTLTRGLTSNKDAWTWIDDVKKGDPTQYRKNGTVSLYNQKGDKVAAYDLTNAWPTSVYTSGTATGGGHNIDEVITITHEGFKRTT